MAYTHGTSEVHVTMEVHFTCADVQVICMLSHIKPEDQWSCKHSPET